ncbi:MAG: tRNA (5-methylaminomethyl-2-thiouridine)(34)-methyltransferase MnmD [Schleiferiaceae bacterium]|nr:tRNA (5-methylaminomethyl-2-thiouridine)(34)-methyltransferase MnmD [Schleiferiaceae bacterium]
MHRELRVTADGSSTIFVPVWDEHYHSIHGAVQESMHVFITNGLSAFATLPSLSILEVGLGTGLNALLTAFSIAEVQQVHYTALEAYPIESALWQHLNYSSVLSFQNSQALFEKLHRAPWETAFPLTENFRLLKVQATLEAWQPTPNEYHLIYFDAFAPSAQPELWTEAIFLKLYTALQPGGSLVTYCAKGSVKRAMKAVGFQVEALPGPPRKREMTRASKPSTLSNA